MNTPIDMNNIDNMFPSNYMKALDIPMPRTFIIESILQEDMGDGKIKPVVRFSGEPKGWVLNKTNAESIKKGYGSHVPHWIGQMIELFTMPVQGPNGIVDGIRCRVPVQQSQPTAPAAPPTAPAAPVAQPAAPAVQPAAPAAQSTAPAVQPAVPMVDVNTGVPKDVETEFSV